MDNVEYKAVYNTNLHWQVVKIKHKPTYSQKVVADFYGSLMGDNYDFADTLAKNLAEKLNTHK